MYIILDTNIIHREYFFKSKSFSTLFSYLKTCGHNLLLPEIVVEELSAHYQNELEEINHNNKKIEVDLATLGISDKIIHVDIQKRTKEYKVFLEKFIRDNKIIVLEHDNINYKAIITRCISKKPPFTSKNGDKGFKDAIIWENVKSIFNSSKYKPFCFITNNTKDFSDPVNKNNLHSILEEELEQPDKFNYFISIESFLEKYGTILDEVSNKIVLGAVEKGFRDEIEKLSIDELKLIFEGGSGYPIDSIEKDDLEYQLEHFYVTKADREYYYVTATGTIRAFLLLFDPIDGEYFGNQLFTKFEASIRIEKKTKKTLIEDFNIKDIPLFY